MRHQNGVPNAIQTRYKGYHFRSRLEARWAVFLDACGTKWQYEVQGYDLSKVTDMDGLLLRKYLPDFWLPEEDVWLEIKPALPDKCFNYTEEERLLWALLKHTKSNEAWVFYGPPELETPASYVYWMRDFRLENSYRKRFLENPQRRPEGGICSLCPQVNDRCVNAARSARFEFGESGRT